MTLASWPVTVPLAVRRSGYTEQIEDAVDQFEVDHGPPLLNSATSVPTVLISFEATYTKDEYDLLVAFYRDTLHRVDKFTRQHPLELADTAGDPVFQFSEPPRLVRVRATKVDVAMTLRHWP